jgi:DNA repair ATPase RecN
VKEINQHIENLKDLCGKYNEAIDDMIQAKEELGYDYDIPAKIDYDFLQSEAIKSDE